MRCEYVNEHESNTIICPFPADEEYGDSKPKKVRTAPREPKHKRSKNSQDDRWALCVHLLEWQRVTAS